MSEGSTSDRTTSPHLRPVATTATSTSTSSKRVTFPVRSATSTATSPKPTGDISSVFPSLSSTSPPPLPPRFADLKKRLIHCHEPSIQASWTRLLAALQQQRQEIKVLGSTIVPEINFWELSDVGKRTKFRDALHKRGVAVIRGVVSEKEALEWKELVQRYIRTNPSTRGPHIDGGSVERWEESGYGGLGGVYGAVFNGSWEDYDPWEMKSRLPVKSNLYNGPGGCSMYRMFQGWLAMSDIAGGQGHLKVFPAVREAVAYLLLRPFFVPKGAATDGPAYLEAINWALEEPVSSALQGAVPAMGQELNAVTHPHLGLDKTMVHMPRVRLGDYVAWHCDTIHAVDAVHTGTSDSSVMYIPACPLTEANAEYLARQRETFAEGTPAPDFPSGEGESQHRGRLTPEYVMKNISVEAQRAMGLAPYDVQEKGIPEPERAVLRKANEILGFAGT
ncbi:MAG: hypothetical protein LQ338_004338 [Usnochroma carphineum]|nr:MAG: hypothetical protein LQ338_004338 [Usnochroma carphineum]